MKALDHSAVSELLERYIAGHLDDETGAAVAAHDRACTQCRREETGLRSLLAPIDGLTPSERSRLRTGLATALSGETQGSAEVVSLRRPLLARLAPALGAAALLAIVVVALARLDFAPQSGDDSGASAPSAENGAVQDAPRVAP
ncbi:MAG TPA: hypothetical protein VHJ82_03740, partial [Actinomycetota bacterium]|nr:hypothetical protein [Actinomycetota bacterium]